MSGKVFSNFSNRNMERDIEIRYRNMGMKISEFRNMGNLMHPHRELGKFLMFAVNSFEDKPYNIPMKMYHISFQFCVYHLFEPAWKTTDIL